MRNIKSSLVRIVVIGFVGMFLSACGKPSQPPVQAAYPQQGYGYGPQGYNPGYNNQGYGYRGPQGPQQNYGPGYAGQQNYRPGYYGGQGGVNVNWPNGGVQVGYGPGSVPQQAPQQQRPLAYGNGPNLAGNTYGNGGGNQGVYQGQGYDDGGYDY